MSGANALTSDPLLARAFFSIDGLGLRFVGFIFGHLSFAINHRSDVDNQDRGMDIPSNAAGGSDFDAAFTGDVAIDLSMNFDLAGFDIGVDHGMIADNQHIARVDGSMEITIDSERTGVLKLTGNRRTFIKESANLL
jgi:hypothetical protein